MLQNYEYFLTLAETRNISQAAQKLFISHQCLSRYLKNLEDECGLTLFTRKPTFALTYAGEALLDSLREIQRVEHNTEHMLTELKSGSVGEVRMGITEGRLRIVLPDLLKAYQGMFPNVTLRAFSAPTREMLHLLAENKLDFIVGTAVGHPLPSLKYSLLLEEELYIVASDNLLRQYLPEQYPQCMAEFANGADIRLFQNMPFTTASKNFLSRNIIDEHCHANGAALNIIYEANQPDLLHMLTANDYAASFCLTMYLPSIVTYNRSQPEDNQLHIFPIKGLTAKIPVYIISQQGHYFPRYTQELMKLVRKQCDFLQ